MISPCDKQRNTLVQQTHQKQNYIPIASFEFYLFFMFTGLFILY